jgi:NADH-quinone oxidoreductase subunit G
MSRLGIGDGEKVRVGAGDTPSIELSARLDAGLPDNAIRIASAHVLTQALGAMSANLTVKKA